MLSVGKSKHLYTSFFIKLVLSTREVERLGTVIAKNVVKRKSGYLYYVDGKGNVCEARMARGGKRKSSKKKSSSRKR